MATIMILSAATSRISYHKLQVKFSALCVHGIVLIYQKLNLMTVAPKLISLKSGFENHKKNHF